jgi:hypothetical protein
MGHGIALVGLQGLVKIRQGAGPVLAAHQDGAPVHQGSEAVFLAQALGGDRQVAGFQALVVLKALPRGRGAGGGVGGADNGLGR